MKKLIKTLAVTISLLAASSIFVDAKVKTYNVSLPKFTVRANNEVLESKDEYFPPFVYRDITYIPLTHSNAALLGLNLTWSPENGLGIVPLGFSMADHMGSSNVKMHPKNFKAEFYSQKVTVNHKMIDNKKEKYPILNYRNVPYFPLTYRFCAKELGWNYYFGKDGLVITSNNVKEKEPRNTEYNKDVAFKDGKTIYNFKKPYILIEVQDPYIYYIKENSVYRMDLNGKNNRKIFHSKSNIGLSVYKEDGKIYISESQGSSPIMSTTTIYLINGLKAEKVEDKGNPIYEEKFTVDNHIVEIRRNEEKTTIDEKDVGYININCYDNGKFFYLEGKKIYSIDAITKEKKYEWDFPNEKMDWIEFKVLDRKLYYGNREDMSLMKDGKVLNSKGTLIHLEKNGDYLLAYFENPSHIMVFSKDGIVLAQNGEYFSGSVSIDGKKLYYVENKTGVLKVYDLKLDLKMSEMASFFLF